MVQDGHINILSFTLPVILDAYIFHQEKIFLVLKTECLRPNIASSIDKSFNDLN